MFTASAGKYRKVSKVLSGISYPPGVKISMVGGKMSWDSLPPGGQAVQGGKINCYTAILLFILPCICPFFFISTFFIKDISTTMLDRKFIFGIQNNNIFHQRYWSYAYGFDLHVLHH